MPSHSNYFCLKILHLSIYLLIFLYIKNENPIFNKTFVLLFFTLIIKRGEIARADPDNRINRRREAGEHREAESNRQAVPSDNIPRFSVFNLLLRPKRESWSAVLDEQSGLFKLRISVHIPRAFRQAGTIRRPSGLPPSHRDLPPASCGTAAQLLSNLPEMPFRRALLLPRTGRRHNLKKRPLLRLTGRLARPDSVVRVQREQEPLVRLHAEFQRAVSSQRLCLYFFFQ